MLIIPIILLVISFLPILLMGENSYVTIHDNLDSEFIQLHLLKHSDNLFSLDSNQIVPQIFNGLERKYMHSEFSIIRLWFYLLPSFWAYVFNSFIVRVIGIIGLFLLIKDFFSDLLIPKIIIVLLCFSFGMLPIYSLYGISVMGQPILLWSFLNLKSGKKRFLSLFLIALFPFYAHFAIIAPFVLVASVFYTFFILLVLKEKISVNYFLGIGILFVSFIIANYLSIENFLFSEEINHRSDWHRQIPNISTALKKFLKTMTMGQYHSSALLGFLVLILGGYRILKKSPNWKAIITIMISIFIISLFNSIYNYISVPLEDHFHLLTSFQFNRFTFLLPFLYYLLLILCLPNFSLKNYLTLIIVLTFCVGNIYFNKEFVYNVKKPILPKKYSPKITTFSSFFSSKMFKKIDNHIKLPKKDYRVVSLGFLPSVAQYNGFYTLDSYQNNYPLSYKKKFREVIEKELDKKVKLKKYFDDWGNRCYLFSAELTETCYLDCKKNNQNNIINHLDINTVALKKMGCRYIISAAKILNASNINLELNQVFKNSYSKNKIYLYKL